MTDEQAKDLGTQCLHEIGYPNGANNGSIGNDEQGFFICLRFPNRKSRNNAITIMPKDFHGLRITTEIGRRPIVRPFDE